MNGYEEIAEPFWLGSYVPKISVRSISPVQSGLQIDWLFVWSGHHDLCAWWAILRSVIPSEDAYGVRGHESKQNGCFSWGIAWISANEWIKQWRSQEKKWNQQKWEDKHGIIVFSTAHFHAYLFSYFNGDALKKMCPILLLDFATVNSGLELYNTISY